MKFASVAQLTVEESKTNPVKKQFFAFGGIVIGGIAAKVFFKPTQRLVQGDSKVFGMLKIVSNVGINVVVNCYFDIIASRQYFDL